MHAQNLKVAALEPAGSWAGVPPALGTSRPTIARVRYVRGSSRDVRPSAERSRLSIRTRSPTTRAADGRLVGWGPESGALGSGVAATFNPAFIRCGGPRFKHPSTLRTAERLRLVLPFHVPICPLSRRQCQKNE